jgi:hypothetical protein
MIALSYSRIENMECPHRFNRLYILKNYQEPQNPAAILGSKVHNLTAEYREHCLKNGLKRDLNWFETKETEIQNPKEWPRELMHKFRNGIFSLIPPKVEWYCIEQTLNFDADLNLLNEKAPRSEIAFRLIPDFAFVRNGKLYVEDDKTGKWPPGETQSKLYPALIARVLPSNLEIKKVAFRYNMIFTNNPITHGPIDVHETKKHVLWVKKQIKTVNEWTEFPKRYAKCCSFCKICQIEKGDL